jgi:hypothetical protein
MQTLIPDCGTDLPPHSENIFMKTEASAPFNVSRVSGIIGPCICREELWQFCTIFGTQATEFLWRPDCVADCQER